MTSWNYSYGPLFITIRQDRLKGRFGLLIDQVTLSSSAPALHSVDGAFYELDHPYMGNGAGSHGDIDYRCEHGSYVIHSAPASSPGTDGKIYQYCSYSLVSVECHD